MSLQCILIASWLCYLGRNGYNELPNREIWIFIFKIVDIFQQMADNFENRYETSLAYWLLTFANTLEQN